MKKIIKYLSIIFIIMFSSCIEEVVDPEVTVDLSEEALLLRFYESQGDFPNSPEAPAFILASEINDNPSAFNLLDIRSQTDFSNGHIEGARNILIKYLFNDADSLYRINPLTKSIVISKNGQASAYFTCLLRMAGIKNVYSLKYGMASWHQDFANDWLNKIGNYPGIFDSFDDELYEKFPITDLPDLQITSDGNIEEKAVARIKAIINEGFKNDIQFISDFNVATSDIFICYGSGRLYYANNNGTFPEFGHPYGTLYYNHLPQLEFRSTSGLQTLPTDKTIQLYSADGQLGACMTAYLRTLGYKVRTILFGANQMFYSRVITDPELTQYAFTTMDIFNFEYVTGN